MSNHYRQKHFIFRCEKCGGRNVQHAMWVKLNRVPDGEDKVQDDFGTWCSGDNSWCDDCGEHTQIKMINRSDPESLDRFSLSFVTGQLYVDPKGEWCRWHDVEPFLPWDKEEEGAS